LLGNNSTGPKSKSAATDYTITGAMETGGPQQVGRAQMPTCSLCSRSELGDGRFNVKSNRKIVGTKRGEDGMIEINTSVQHCLGQQEALARIQQLVVNLTQRFPQQVHQVNLHMKDHRFDVSFAAYGYLVAWRAEVYDDQISLSGSIPESARQFQNKMEQAVVSRLEAALSPAPLPIPGTAGGTEAVKRMLPEVA
jgi:hypothetical protein